MSRVGRYVLPVLRLGVFFVVCAAVVVYADYRVARASVVERLLAFSQRMAPYLDDGRGTEAPREVHINGLKMFVAAGHTTHPPAMVKKWYADKYAGPGTAADLLAQEERKLLKILPPGTSSETQAMFGDDSRGGMAALDFGGGLTFKALHEKVVELAKGRPLGEVVKMRYMYYERTPTGGTRFLTVWNDSSFDLARFLPPDGGGDAPGRDIERVPRYPGTVRLLSSDEVGQAAQLAIYNGPGSAQGAELFYRARMHTLGWQEDARFAQAARDQGLNTMRFGGSKGHEVVIALSDEKDGGGVTVTAIELR